MFTLENTQGFDQDTLNKMNVEVDELMSLWGFIGLNPEKTFPKSYNVNLKLAHEIVLMRSNED